MYHDLTKGASPRSLLFIALPMMAGNLYSFYNITDTLIVGRVLGKMLWRRGIFLHADDIPDLDLSGAQHGLRRTVFHLRGKGDERALKSSIAHACGLILAVTLV